VKHIHADISTTTEEQTSTRKEHNILRKLKLPREPNTTAAAAQQRA
jgi:hypothetical protein